MKWLSTTLRRHAGSFLERYSHRRAGRMVTVFPDDTFLVSYPKSGNTWLRFLLANLPDHKVAMTFLELERRIPDLYLNTNFQLLGLPRPRVLKSHECFDPRYRKVVYLVRDPRDVVISSYRYHLKRREIPDGYPMELFVPRWLADTEWGATLFGNWRQHVLTWTVTRGNDDGFLMIRYEDMKNNPQRELAKVAALLGLNATPERLAHAIKLSSPERMRELEKQQHEEWGMTKGFRPDVPFIGKATAGAWKSVLSSSSVREIELACGAVMKSLGYVLTGEAVGSASVATLATTASATRAR